MESESPETSTGIGGLWRLWLLLVLSFVCVQLAYDLVVMGYVDLRVRALAQLVVVPSAQAGVFWLVTRRLRQGRGSPR